MTGHLPIFLPLLQGTAGARARAAVEAVAAALSRAPVDAPFHVLTSVADRAERAALQLSLSNGWAGVALLFAALRREPAVLFLEQALTLMPETDLDASLHGGFVGLAFASELVGAHDGDDPNSEVDAVLARLLALPWHGDLDVIDGLAGVGAYLLERLRRGRSGAGAALEQVVARLAERAVPCEGGLTWLGRGGVRDFGLAHGVPGIMVFLAKAHRRGVSTAVTRPLLEGSLAWLTGHERPAAPSRYPGLLTASGRVKEPRQGWCSGDLGVATALLAAARALGDPAGEARGIVVARHAASRAPDETTSFDASLCHGAAGAAHLLHRLYRATGDEFLGEAARRWFDRVLSLRSAEAGAGIGGYLVHEGEPKAATWLAHPGFLVGAAGTALALLAAIDDPGADSPWDRVLLLGDL